MGERWKGAAFAALALMLVLGGMRFLTVVRAAPAGAVAPAPLAGARAARPRKVTTEANAAASPALVPSGTPALPRSLRDTDVDGALRTDANGDLIVGPEVATLFEYFLSATGEETPATIRTRIIAAIDERLQGKAREQALALLDRYLDYRDATRGLSAKSEDLADRLAALRQLRRERLGAEDAERLFEVDEKINEVAIKTRQIEADTTLSPAERERRVAGLEDELPETTREAREATRRPLLQRAEEEELRASGASDEALYAHRVATVGAEAAERLTELDTRRAGWSRRLDAFRAERALLLARSHDLATQHAEEAALLARGFTPEEQLRVRAILSMQGE